MGHPSFSPDTETVGLRFVVSHQFTKTVCWMGAPEWGRVCGSTQGTSELKCAM